MADKQPRDLDHAFTSQDCDQFVEALELAWTMFLKTERLNPANLDTTRAALTLGILDGAEKGELNRQRLAIMAVHHFDRFQPRDLSRSACGADAA